jgi:hypothetical protein
MPRVVAALMLCALFSLVAVARAEISHPAPGYDKARSATALLLLEARQRSTPKLHVERSNPRDDASSEATDEPELTRYVEQMWSQVRAYRRPGGAEVILRGKF